MRQLRNTEIGTRGINVFNENSRKSSTRYLPHDLAEILFIDDFSRLKVLRMMQHKSQAMQVLGESTHDVAAANQPVISALRSDQGGGFTGVIFEEVCKRNDVKQEFTARLSPHQNGTTLMNMNRFILDDGSSPQFPRWRWGTFLQTAMYLSSRLPTRANGGETPLLELPWKNIVLCHIDGR